MLFHTQDTHIVHFLCTLKSTKTKLDPQLVLFTHFPPSKDHVAVAGGNVPISHQFPDPHGTRKKAEFDSKACFSSKMQKWQRHRVSGSNFVVKAVMESSIWSWFHLHVWSKM